MTTDNEAPTGFGPGTGADDAKQTAVLIELVREMRGQRESFGEAQRLAASERTAERRRRMLFQALVFGFPVLLGVGYFLFFLSSAGFRWGPFGDVIGVVRIEGEIAAGKVASADRVIPSLENAFKSSNVTAIVLSIDSPGGAPVESERINNAIEGLRKRHPKPVVAVINNLGASAAYMIAIHADKIVAGKYSLVGSIGAVMAPWQLDRALARVDVSQRVYASGPLKAFLNPFTPVTPDVDAKAHSLVDELGGAFLAEVKQRRGNTLKSGVDYGTGEIWGGAQAREIGLVDTIGTIDEYVQNTWGLKSYDFGPSHEALQLFAKTVGDGVGGAVAEALNPIPSVH